VAESNFAVTVGTSTCAKIVAGKVFVITVVYAEHANHVVAAAYVSTAKTKAFASSATLNARLVRTAGYSTSARNAEAKAYATTVVAGQIVQNVRVPVCASTKYIVTDARIAEEAAFASTAAFGGSAKSAGENFIAFTEKTSGSVSNAMGVGFASMV
jgi:hypothetical protein